MLRVLLCVSPHRPPGCGGRTTTEGKKRGKTDDDRDCGRRRGRERASVHFLERDDPEESDEKISLPSVTGYPSCTASPPPSGHMASLSLADHMDMCRPVHEAPAPFIAMAAREESAAQYAAGGLKRRHVVTLVQPGVAGAFPVRRRAATGAGPGRQSGAGAEGVAALSRSLPTQPIAIAPAGMVSQRIFLAPHLTSVRSLSLFPPRDLRAS